LTSESFGIVPLSTSIHDLPSIALTPEILGGLSRDKAYLADRLGTKLPLLPVVGKAEKALFNRLVVQCGGDFEKMTLAWSDNVNGTTIFPKIAAQLRIHKKKWGKAEAVKKLLAQSAAGRAMVQKVLTENTIASVLRPTMPLAIPAPNNSPRNSSEIPEGLNLVADYLWRLTCLRITLTTRNVMVTVVKIEENASHVRAIGVYVTMLLRLLGAAMVVVPEIVVRTLRKTARVPKG